MTVTNPTFARLILVAGAAVAVGCGDLGQAGTTEGTGTGSSGAPPGDAETATAPGGSTSTGTSTATPTSTAGTTAAGSSTGPDVDGTGTVGGGGSSSGGASSGGSSSGGSSSGSSSSGGSSSGGSSSGGSSSGGSSSGGSSSGGSSSGSSSGGASSSDGGSSSTGPADTTRRVFVTSSASNADFGGPTGADMVCDTLAMNAGIGGSWSAWLSTETEDAATRIDDTGAPYVLVDGTQIAEDIDALLDGTLDAPINRDESGGLVNADVWTGTLADGTAAGFDCSGWTGIAGTGRCGAASQSGSAWTDNVTPNCSISLRLYCFENG
ncbi:MAG: hypothetical protein AAF721_30275 [Myxococcota bacterium]